MIRLARPLASAALKPATRAALARRQRTASALPPGDKRIGTAWAAFLRSSARAEVAGALDRCFRFKCAYCEGVAAQDIEHFYPKTDYPGRMFEWDNLLRGQFPLDGGRPVLLDPCRDDPLDYFVWDFQTGATGVRPEPPFVTRGTTTRDLFRLDLEPLREERRLKLRSVLFLLACVVNETPVRPETKGRLREELDHRRPWLGIIRQLFRRPGPKYARLLKAAQARLPEIAQWVAGWL